VQPVVVARPARADPVGLVEHDDLDADALQLGGGGETGRSRADDDRGDPLGKLAHALTPRRDASSVSSATNHTWSPALVSRR
jgi:hypothetical protein